MAPPAFVRAVSFGVYEGTMRSAIHALKYDRMAPLARELGARLAAAIELPASRMRRTRCWWCPFRCIADG
jgi:predicted amidophosphoribosyltransferase